MRETMITRNAIVTTLLLALLLIGCMYPSAGFAHNNLDVKVQPTRNVYRVGEPIDLLIKGNRDFYLYLFTVDGDREVGRLLTPASPEDIRKYKAHRVYQVPGGDKKLVSDESGVERIIMLASSKPVDLPDHINHDRSDDYLKSLRIVNNAPAAAYCVKELNIIVR